MPDTRSLVYRQVNTARSGRYRITKTYTTDPARSAVLVDVRFESLTGDPYSVYVLHDAALGLNANDDMGWSAGGGLVAADGVLGGAVLASSGFTATSSGYRSRSDGWSDLQDNFRMDWSYTARERGNVVQLGRTRLTGLPGAQRLTLALGFATTPGAATATARAALERGFAAARAAYTTGWHRYLQPLKPVPPQRRPLAGHLRRVGDGAGGQRGQDVPRRLRGGAGPAVGVGELAPVPARLHRGVVARPVPRSRPPCSPPATRPRPAAPSTTCGTSSSDPTARSRRTRGWTASRCSAASSSTRWPSRSCSPGSSTGLVHATGSTCAGRRTSSWPTDRTPRRSAGRTSPAGRRPRSLPRSPRWCAPPTSRGATGSRPPPSATWPPPTTGRATWSAGR
jgi:hypothetical protein